MLSSKNILNRYPEQKKQLNTLKIKKYLLIILVIKKINLQISKYKKKNIFYLERMYFLNIYLILISKKKIYMPC